MFGENLVRDAHFGFRMLRRSPGFSLLVILCLTIGIGANAAVFSWIEGILLRPFPKVAQQDRLLALVGTKAGESGLDDVSWPDFVDLRRNCTLIQSFIADKITGTTLNVGDRAEVEAASIVSSNYFDALGIHLFMGRVFEPAEEQGRNAHPVKVISYWLWKERFHGDRDILGKTQLLNGVPHTIIGVAPEGFYGTFVGYRIQFWVPISMQELFEGAYALEDRSARWIEGFVLPKPGVTAEQAEQELSRVARRLEAQYPQTNRGRGVEVLPLWKTPFNAASEQLPVLKLSGGVVLLLLLIVCANVSNLLLVRSFARRREMVMRLAIGAGRDRLIGQLFTEGLILSSCASIGGVLIAYFCRNLIAAVLPSRGESINLSGHLDLRVLALSVGIAVLATLLFSLIPAIQNGKLDIAGSLRSESGAVFGARGKSRIRSGLVLVQILLSFVLLVGAALLIESVRNVRAADPGFSTQNVLTSSVDLTAAGYDTQRARDFREALVERIQNLRGVESAAYSLVRPFTYVPYPSARIAVDGYQPRPDELPMVDYNQVDPGYLRTMGIALMSGRDFTRFDNENSVPVAIVNEKMIAQYWHGEVPVGKRLQVEGRTLQVIGVVKVSKYYALGEAPRPFFYIPMRQGRPTRDGIINIRTSADPALMTAELVRVVRELDANLAPTEVITMREQVNRIALASQQVAVSLLGIFGGLAVLLAGVGLYGIISYAVSQSTREFGLRIALGASSRDLLQLVFSHGLTLVAAGVILGTATALSMTRLFVPLLYKVNPRDPIAFASALAVIATASITALFLPARRASKTDPALALRE